MSARVRVYVDACVLILAASAAEDDVARKALAELDRSDVDYVYTALVEHEVLPNPLRNGRDDQVAFFRHYLSEAIRVACDEEQQQGALAMRIACPGLGLVDAFHLSAAASAGANEFVTAEGSTKPMVANPPASVQAMVVRTIRT